MKRRALLVTARAALAGAAIASAVACACAVWSPVRGPGLPPVRDAWRCVTEAGGFGYRTRHEWSARGVEGVPTSWHRAVRGEYLAGWPVPMLASAVAPGAAERDDPGRAPAGLDLPLTEMVRRGFPTNRLPAFVSALPERRVPVAPLWGGVAVNTAFWGAASAAAAFGAAKARRSVLRRAGRCARCGYDLGGLGGGGCPECGGR